MNYVVVGVFRVSKIRNAVGSALKDFDNDGLADIAITTSEFAHLQQHAISIWFLHQRQPGLWSRVDSEWGSRKTSGSWANCSRCKSRWILDLLAADFERDP